MEHLDRENQKQCTKCPNFNYRYRRVVICVLDIRLKWSLKLQAIGRDLFISSVARNLCHLVTKADFQIDNR